MPLSLSYTLRISKLHKPVIGRYFFLVKVQQISLAVLLKKERGKISFRHGIRTHVDQNPQFQAPTMTNQPFQRRDMDKR